MLKPLWSELADSLTEVAAINHEHLRSVGNRIFRKSRYLGREQRVSWRVRPGQIACQRDAHDGRESAAIQWIPLHNHHGPPKPGGRIRWHRQIRPPDLPLRDLTLLVELPANYITTHMPERTPPTNAQKRRWIEQWRSAGVALARVRAEELQRVDLLEVSVQLEDASRMAIARHPPLPSSGLIEQQRILHR